VVRPVEPDEVPAFRALLERHHYLGDARLVGESMRHVAEANGRWVALLAFAAAALKSRHREAWIGWDEATKVRRLHFIANNVRFLVLPGARVPHLASAVLARSTRRLSRDFEARYGHPVLVAETFVDVERFRGTCYLAANWTRLGLTRGMARHGRGYKAHGRKKAHYAIELERRAREMLAAPMLPPQVLRRMAMAKLPGVVVDVNELPLEGEGGLLDVLGGIPDPRHRRGLRHRFEGVLAAAVMASLSGMQGYEGIAEWTAELPRDTCRRLGFYCWKPPSEPTIRRVLQSVDADAVDRVVGAWLAAQTACEAVALDGKTLRGSHDGEQAAVHLLAAVTHGTGVVVAQRDVEEKSNEIPGAAPLLADVDLAGKTVTADAMHTQVDLAKHIVEERHADYVFTVKGNQPTLLAQLEGVAWESLPPSGHDTGPRARAGGAAHDPADR
jgi:predicted transposase YbfD/YdcC